MPTTLAFSLALALASQAEAEAAAEATASVDETAAEAAPRPAEECRPLFGYERDRAFRKELREESLADVERGEVLLDIVHNVSSWQAPALVRVPGVDVIAVEGTGEGESPRARVRVDDTWAELCPTGEYSVGIDDALGSEGAVLAIVDEGVLAEHNGNLVFLPKPGERVPRVRMIWQSAFGLSVEPGKNASLGGGGGAKSAKVTKADRQRAKADAKAARENRRAAKAVKPPRG